MPIFYETHAHLDYQDFAGDVSDVIERAQAAGIVRIIAIGTDFESSARVLALSERFPPVFAAVGWHPCQAREAPADIRGRLRDLARHPKVVAIGETGLDYRPLPGEQARGGPADDDRARQRDLFQQHLEVAAELGLNCVVHQREALDPVLDQMKPFAGRVRGVFHCFVGDASAMRRVVDLESFVSFTGIVTFKNAEKVRATVADTPLDKMMFETDCPFLAPVPYRGKRAEPAHVREVAATVAQIKGCSAEELSAVTCATAGRFFPKLSPPH